MATSVVACLLALAPAVPVAAETPLPISTDGVSYAPTLHHPLFSSRHGLVPRSSRTSTLYVKNPTARSVTVSLATVGVRYSRHEIASALTVTAAAASAESSPVHLSSAGSCAPLLTGLTIPAHAEAAIHLTLAMADVTGAAAQQQSVGFNVRLSMRDREAPVVSDPCSLEGTDMTGFGAMRHPARARSDAHSDATVPLIATGVLIVFGCMVARPWRRRRGRE